MFDFLWRLFTDHLADVPERKLTEVRLRSELQELLLNPMHSPL
jgi:hypothetical protein